ncbi:MAG: hydroxyacylglutathione hydrolase [Gammaproteobacteria bacterium TMED78]|nr:MAG: hydroxyacylglutathione hydrolase [Gammaproteobacteria bacterium TMED78]|tara:strand:+ start:621 stop:1412 length:792 start_codon:yes stop_codon:yes gene_type:complete
MIVEQIWTNNPYRNFNYLLACDETGEALAIDPLDHSKCLNIAKDNGWDITKIINTHHHLDHIGGNDQLISKTNAKLLAHENANHLINNIDIGLSGGDVVKIGKTIELEVLDTPGHTMSHVCLLSHSNVPSLFSGDTLFNAGAGNCHNGGDPYYLFSTFKNILSKLKDDTLLYPGHEYIENNIRFTLNLEPDNLYAKDMLDRVSNQDPNYPFVTNIGIEKKINTFFRLNEKLIIENIVKLDPEIKNKLNKKNIFLALRELRNNW